MRYIITIILILTIKVSQAQDISFPLNSSGEVEYSGVEQVDSANAKALFTRAKIFITQTFVSGKAVTDLIDENSNTIIAKGLIPIYVDFLGKPYDYGDVRVNVTIQCKDGKYRYVFTDFYHERHTSQGNYDGGKLNNEKPACGTLFLTKKFWAEIKKKAKVEIEKFVEELKAAMKSNKSSDW